MTQIKPLLGITMGDPAGTGSEIIVRAFSENLIRDSVNVGVIGDAITLQKAADMQNLSINLSAIDDIEHAQFEQGVLNVLDLQNVDHDTMLLGQVSAMAGKAAYEYIDLAIQLALEKKISAIVTSAINKESLHLAGYTQYAGHTEILADKTNSKNVSMMLAAGGFRVTHVSTHCALRTAIDRCKTPRILDVIRLTHQSLKNLGIDNPLIAVAGLNPHSGEQGLFGTEEITEIQPAIEAAIAEGINVSPKAEPPDTVFVRMKNNKAFDAVVAQYHDQGHIAAKLVDFFGGVNITLGLNIIRTSVDHGTAFDIAGTGKARPDSLISAINYATRLAQSQIG
jgi:4-hydroxythreonine-4-phosphate dehydrogenase